MKLLPQLMATSLSQLCGDKRRSGEFLMCIINAIHKIAISLPPRVANLAVSGELKFLSIRRAMKESDDEQGDEDLSLN
jgi:hypothetical protein